MAFKSKYRGDQIEALLDRVNSGESGGTVLSNTFLVIGDYNSDARNNFEGVASGNKSADYYVGVVNVGGTKLQGIATIYSSEEGTSFSFIGYPSAGEYSHRMVKVTCTYNGSNFNTVLDPIMDYKQDVIDDLDNIRLGANLGVTALQNIPSEYITETELVSKNYLTTIPAEYVTDSELSAKGYVTVSQLDSKVNISDLSTVATSGDYNDLLNTPSIPDISGKVDKVTGKGLSTEDFTTVLKEKLQSLTNYDDTSLTTTITNIRNDLDTLVGGNTSTAIDTFNEIIAFLDGIEDSQDLESIIASIELQIASKMDKVTLATVATTGSYNDLSNKPTIPAEQVNADWNATSGKAQILNKPTIPSAITESTVSGWGFTKNTGTITGVSANGTSVATSGVANIPAASTSVYGVTKLTSSTSSTSTSLAATASAVKAAYDLANSYKGTVTGVKINGTTKNPSSGIVDLGTVITAHQTLKTINGESIVGSGDITISGGNSDANVMAVDTGDVLDDVNVDYATTLYVNGLIGDINSVLESIING